MLITVPPELPNSALKKFVWILNSSTTSTVGWYFTSVTPPFCSIPVSAPPSSSTSDALLRTPLDTKFVPLPMGITPGASEIKSIGLREFSGTLMIIRFSTTWPRFADVVFSKGAEACTSTLVETEPTVNSTSTVACCCTSRRKTGCVVLSNPATCTVRVYLAAGRVGKTYRPEESLTVEYGTLRSASVTVILAPGTPALVLSVIVPRIDPVYDCDQDRMENNQTESTSLYTISPLSNVS